MPQKRVLRSAVPLSLVLMGCTARGPTPVAGQQTPAPAEAAMVATAPPPAEARRLTTTAGALGLEVAPQFERVLLGKSPVEVNVLVRLRGEGKAAGERPPLDLAVVLDRSGSMSGDKILAVKQAALDLLKELRPADRITLISYSDDVTVHVELLTLDAQGVDTTRAQILPIQPDGGTALGPGLIRGLELLERAKRRERDLAHLLLFSDGQANVGEQNPEVLGARAAQAFKANVSVSTLGVGLDYNEDLMTKIADAGGGRYHFIKGADEVGRVLADELAGLVSTSATGISLDLKPAAGVAVTRVFGYPAREEAGATKVSVGSIGAQQAREIVVRMSVAAAPAPVAGGELALGVLGVGFTDLVAGGKPGRLELALALATAADEADARRSERTEVTVRVAEVESSEQLQLAARRAESGDYEGAKQVIGRSLEALEAQQKATPSPKLQAQIDDLKQASQGVDAARTSDVADKMFKKDVKAKAYKKMK
ncbi:MAG: VWA domain-containing protein [Myxococcales bacterium]|nr:VWA domain-containing protein [Myxococcales bacterium]